jgi:hypothetical protein
MSLTLNAIIDAAIIDAAIIDAAIIDAPCRTRPHVAVQNYGAVPLAKECLPLVA